MLLQSSPQAEAILECSVSCLLAKSVFPSWLPRSTPWYLWLIAIHLGQGSIFPARLLPESKPSFPPVPDLSSGCVPGARTQRSAGACEWQPRSSAGASPVPGGGWDGRAEARQAVWECDPGRYSAACLDAPCAWVHAAVAALEFLIIFKQGVPVFLLH